jgi:hypothetical protein
MAAPPLSAVRGSTGSGSLIKQLPKASKVKRRYARNTTGEIGVALVRERTPAGTLLWRYVAQWPTCEGRRAKASFSVAFYGRGQARRLQ